MEAKVIFLGSTNAGKTTILGTYRDKKFLSQTHPTLGIDTIKIKHSPDLTIQYWDTAGQEKYNSVNFTYIKKADGIVLVYDPAEDDEELKNNLNFWIDTIKDNSDILEKNEHLWLVANNKTKETIDSDKELKRTSALFQKLNKNNFFVINQMEEKGDEAIKSLFQSVEQQMEIEIKGKINLENNKPNSGCNC